MTAEIFRPSREFLTQIFPILWKQVLRQEPTENLLPEFVAWGRLLNKIALTSLEKTTEIDFKVFPELAFRAFRCLDLLFDTETMIYMNLHFSDHVPSPSCSPGASSSDPSDDMWPKSLAVEICDSCLGIVCKVGHSFALTKRVSTCLFQMLEQFFSHQVYEEYMDPTSEELLESILTLFSQVTGHLFCGGDGERCG